jgi:hypothetical protein
MSVGGPIVAKIFALAKENYDGPGMHRVVFWRDLFDER